MGYPKWWNDTITLYHKNTDKDENERTQTMWERRVIKNCFYRTKKNQVLNGMVLTSKDSTIVRIPYNSAICIGKGDIVLNGEALEEIPKNTAGNEIKAKYNGFIIESVKTNIHTKNLKHFYASEG